MGVKMNILLFAPGLLVLLVQYRGISTALRHMWEMMLIQVRSATLLDLESPLP